ncbi:MAG: hypothetical protein AAB519_03690 [Patescibacteria group bacterium]
MPILYSQTKKLKVLPKTEKWLGEKGVVVLGDEIVFPEDSWQEKPKKEGERRDEKEQDQHLQKATGQTERGVSKDTEREGCLP